MDNCPVNRAKTLVGRHLRSVCHRLQNRIAAAVGINLSYPIVRNRVGNRYHCLFWERQKNAMC